MNRIDIKPDCVFSPQPMYIIGTKNEDGSPNFCIITWLGFSFDKTPQLVMTIGGSKLTKTNIMREKKFSANLITEDIIWLADYFGCSMGEKGIKNAVNYGVGQGKSLDIPTVEESHWVYECEVRSITELDGAHLFLSEIKNIQIDESYKDMDMEMIDLTVLKPAIYAPYNYFSIGQRLGGCGEWQERLGIEK